MKLLRIDELQHEARRRWAAGRVWAAHEAPYLASALLALDPVVVEDSGHDLSAFPCDPRWHVYIDPVVLEAVAVEELGFWLLHQVSHLLREHRVRYPGVPVSGGASAVDAGPLGARSADQQRWNVAGDAEINDDLHTANLRPPERAVHPSQLGLPDRWIAEQYWEALDPGPRADEGWQAPHDCGSGCDGQDRDWDCGRRGLSEIGARLVGRETARRILEHSRERGDTPAGWERWAEQLLEPSVNWRRQLAAHVRRGAADVTGRVDFTYRRPSRRASAVPDVVLPSLRQPLPQVAVVIDTSGSMSDSMLGQALGEVTGVLRSLGIARRNLRVIACDATAYGAQAVRDVRTIKLSGGGGTDMGAGIDAAAALRPRPDLIVVLTDGFTPWRPAPPPGIRVVVGLMDRGGNTPPWAETVLIGAAAEGRR